MKKIFLLLNLLAFAFTSCNRDDSHIVLPENPDTEQGGAVVGFNTDGVTNKKFEDTHLYGFDAAGKMILHNYYPTQKELSGDMFTMENGAYTFIAVLNVGEAFSPETRAGAPLHNVTMNQFMSYVKRAEDSYPDMLTGMINRTITTGKVERIEIPLTDKSGGIQTVTTVVTATVTLPDAEFAEYQKARTKATAPHNLRAVAEFYQKGKSEPTHHASVVLTPTGTEGQYTLATEVFDGEYDMVLWVDYTESGSTADLWYDTKNLQAVKLIATDKSYTTHTDTREVFYGSSTVVATGGAVNVTVTTERPQAKYLLIADDIKRYKELMAANPEKYVPLDELSVAIQYDSYLPDGFNAKEGKPNSSQTGYRCNKVALPAVGESDTEVKIGSDYVFVNGGESSVTVTVLVTDKTGRTVSRVQGVVVEYKRNMLTTVRGDFLTAGVVNPGINIDTDWEGVHNVEF